MLWFSLPFRAWPGRPQRFDCHLPPILRQESSLRPSPIKRLAGGSRFNEGGRTFVHLEGSPEQRGIQHGYLMAREK
jgi:hypothetical protein